MKVVADTNVYVSATFSKGNPYRILEAAEQGEIQLYISPFILREIEDVLGREKIPFEEEQVNRFVDKVLSVSKVVSPDSTPNAIKQDPSDNEILACALRAGAEYIVSGDSHLLELDEYEGVEITEPAKLVQIL